MVHVIEFNVEDEDEERELNTPSPKLQGFKKKDTASTSRTYIVRDPRNWDQVIHWTYHLLNKVDTASKSNICCHAFRTRIKLL